MKQKHQNRKVLRTFTVTLVLCLILSVASGVSAQASQSSVQQAARGVLQFNLVYRDDYNQDHTVKTGSCFLINSSNIVTAAHCTVLTDEELAAVAESFGRSTQETYSRLGYSVTISRDVTLPATLEMQPSHEMDFAILRLQRSLHDREAVVVRHSSEVVQTEQVFAIGFPDQIVQVQDINRFTSDDVTITDGRVNKIVTGRNLWSWANADFIQSSCKLTAGMSGGPMVDKDGYAIGICHGGTGELEEPDDYYYAVCIDQLLTVCDSLGITYSLNAENNPVITAAPVVTSTPDPASVAVDTSRLTELIQEASSKTRSAFTADSYNALQTALDNAISARNSDDQTTVDRAARALQSAINDLVENNSGTQTNDDTNLTLILIIAAAVVLAILVIVLIIVLNGKKRKKSSGKASARSAATTSGSSGAFAPSPKTPAQPTRGTIPLEEAGATSVLNSGAGETTVLSQNVRGGMLLRRKTGDRIEINRAEFVVGRERSRVTYCISDNSNIGRVHAKFFVRDGKTYLADQRSVNGTFVNGVKADPLQEILLKSGDKIALANEEFDFQA